jgi:hypothetical protein
VIPDRSLTFGFQMNQQQTFIPTDVFFQEMAIRPYGQGNSGKWAS